MVSLGEYVNKGRERKSEWKSEYYLLNIIK